jgi:endonuclease-3
MKRQRSVSPYGTLKVLEPSTSESASLTPHTSKKLKLHSSYTISSPFPDFTHPTPKEAAGVHALLFREHPSQHAVRSEPTGSTNSATNCGNVPNVIEALISTILSQNTSGKNSSAAKASLDAAFGRNNFAVIASAPREEVVDAIRQGGLANKKAATIQNILNSVKEKHGDYSLQHLTATEDGKRLTDDDIMKELISYDGVGPKTASCVLLFCLGRDSFAVDTHVFRLSKLLGWVPEKADRVLAQAHLDLKIPRELKYGLHVLMIQHGRTCRGCKKAGSGTSCVLKTYLKQTRD